MQKPTDVRKFVIGAEQAEARGDHAEAERLLRRALVLQEFSLGAEHIEVAKTLNNLAIVSEMNGRLGDAETCYRRAYAIAVAKLAPTDPFFVTSRENLEQFCQARGLPFTRPPVSPDAPMRPPAPPPRAAAPPSSAPRASAPPRTAPAQTAAPPSAATSPSPGGPAQTVVPPRMAAPPKPVTAPRTTTPANAAQASTADMPFLSEATMSRTSAPTRTATPPKPVTPPPPTATTTSAARSVTLDDMSFRSEATIARPSAAVRADETLPMTHSAVPVLVARRGPRRAMMLTLAALVLVTAGWYWFASSTPNDRGASSVVSSAGNTPVPAADPAPPEPKPSQPAPSAAAEPEAAAPRAAEPRSAARSCRVCARNRHCAHSPAGDATIILIGHRRDRPSVPQPDQIPGVDVHARHRHARSRTAVLLHACGVSERHDDRASVVSRRTTGTARIAAYPRQSRRLPHLQPAGDQPRSCRVVEGRTAYAGRRVTRRRLVRDSSVAFLRVSVQFELAHVGAKTLRHVGAILIPVGAMTPESAREL